MWSSFLGLFSNDIGIDLGTANTIMYMKDKEVILNQPSIVAINTNEDRLIAVGDEAKKMLGKAPKYIDVIRPLKDGVIADFKVAEKMIIHDLTNGTI